MTLKKQENTVYLIVWGIIFVIIIPLSKFLTGTSHTDTGAVFDAILKSWMLVLPLLVLFLIHNYLIMPYLLEKDRKGIYAVLTLALLCVFLLFTLLTRDVKGPHRGPGDRMMDRHDPERTEMRRMPPPDASPGMQKTPREEIKFRKAPMRPFDPEVISFILALLVLGCNLATGLFFRSLKNEQELKDLQRENLNSQLQYLRYQISPHFFMNTLNNIHALVDIDPEKAKESIVQLSKLMRYMLYEGSKPTIPLEKEISFLSQYVSLMRLRYNDSVKISFSVPEEVPGVEIPPLLFISYVENAFKHGVSYQRESFIDIAMTVTDGRLHFACRNSRNGEEDDNGRKGIGMDNTQRRLNLLYGKDYTMAVENKDNVYTIDVDIPTKMETKEETI